MNAPRNYYYFAASLPMLEFGMTPPMPLETFLEDCERLVSPEDFSYIKRAVFSGKEKETGYGVLKEWKQFEHNFRNEAAWFRANQAHQDPLDHIRGERVVEPSVSDTLAQAVKSPDPLSGERLLDRRLWQQLDELGEGHYFDIDFLILYAARLKILERHQEIASSRGEEIFEGYKREAFY